MAMVPMKRLAARVSSAVRRDKGPLPSSMTDLDRSHGSRGTSPSSSSLRPLGLWLSLPGSGAWGEQAGACVCACACRVQQQVRPLARLLAALDAHPYQPRISQTTHRSHKGAQTNCPHVTSMDVALDLTEASRLVASLRVHRY